MADLKKWGKAAAKGGVIGIGLEVREDRKLAAQDDPPQFEQQDRYPPPPTQTAIVETPVSSLGLVDGRATAKRKKH
jgi:hypothetical protein